MGEGVFKWNPETKACGVDEKRVILCYSFNNYFNLAEGELYIPSGFRNDAWHDGALVQATIYRPNIVAFEGGLLPIHRVGIQLDGSGVTDLNIDYNAFSRMELHFNFRLFHDRK